MPPPTPRTTRGAPAGCARPASAPSSWLRSGLDGLGGQQAVVDLAQGDAQRLLVHVRLDQRADVLEQALPELGVVRVDLTGALGAVDDQGVLGVGGLEQVVDRRVRDAF